MHSEGIKYYKLGLKRPVHNEGITKNPDMPKKLKKIIYT